MLKNGHFVDNALNDGKNVFFDFGRTLVCHPEDEAGREIIRKRGVTNEEDIIFLQNVLYTVKGNGNDMDEGKLSREDFKKDILKRVPERLHKAALDAFDYHITELTPIKEMVTLAKQLKEEGYHIYITSNLDIYHTKQMYDTEYKEIFDGMIFSSEVKTRKPRADFFEYALDRFGVKRESCVFIDDLQENIDGANAVGIKGFLFKNNPEEVKAFIYDFYENTRKNK